MDIAWFRDLIICISGVLVIVVLILSAILVVAIYRKSKSILHSVEDTSKNLQEISSALRDNIATPFTDIGKFIRGISKIRASINGAFRKKKGGN